MKGKMVYFSRWIVALRYTNNDVISENIISLRIVYTMKFVIFSGSHKKKKILQVFMSLCVGSSKSRWKKLSFD